MATVAVPEPPTSSSGCDDLLEMLNGSSEAMDLEWLLDEENSTGPDFHRQAIAYGLQNVSAASRCLATPQRNLSDQSTMSRSLATTTPTSARNHQAAAAVKVEKDYSHLSNMSSVSHNLANVGALPQCNQRHARFTVNAVAVAEEIDFAQPFHFTSLAVAASDGKCRPQAVGVAGQQRRRATAATADQMKKLELRRAKNREAAERMRRRRREQTVGLEQSVKELTARVDELAAKLAASEAENQQLRTLNHLVFPRTGNDETSSNAQCLGADSAVLPRQEEHS